MDAIKNINLIEGFLTPIKFEKLKKHAEFFVDKSNINFEIADVKNDVINVIVTQGNTLKINVVSIKELERIARSLFEFYLPENKIQIGLGAFIEHKDTDLTTEWIQKRMKVKNISPEQISEETGLNLSTIEGWIKNTRTMSKLSKALFWYMLK